MSVHQGPEFLFSSQVQCERPNEGNQQFIFGKVLMSTE